MNRTPPSDMTDDEIDHELSWTAELWEKYAEMGQGISTKEVVRRNDVLAERDRRRDITRASNIATMKRIMAKR